MRQLALLVAFLCPLAAFAFAPAFQLPFDDNLTAAPGGDPLQAVGQPTFIDGKVGRAAEFPSGACATYSAKGSLSKSQGSLCFWLRPSWNGDDGLTHGLFADISNFNDKLQNTLYLWKWSTGQLRLDLRCPADPYLTYDVRNWKAGQWHHVGATWDARRGLALFVDGECVARRESTYEVADWPQFNVGGDWAGKGSAEAAFDDLRLYPTALGAAQMAAIMNGLPLEEAAVTQIVAPARVRVGQPFTLKLQARATAPLTRDYAVLVRIDGVEVASAPVVPPGAGWAAGKTVDLAPIQVTVPSYLRVPPGKSVLTAELAGAVAPPNLKPVEAAVAVSSAAARAGHEFSSDPAGRVYRDGRPFPSPVSGEGFLYEGVFYIADEAGNRKAAELYAGGLIQDALAARLIDAVDCSGSDHGLVEYGATTVRQLLGRSFRVTGPPESVQLKVQAYGQERRALPGFSYTLRNTPLPVPHVLVAELPNDAERYTEIAVDAAPGSHLAPHLLSGGPGDTRLIDLSTVYTGREYRPDGAPFHHSVIFYPKSDACEVTVTTSPREAGQAPGEGAAVSRLWIYQLLDEQAGLYNDVPLPREGPRRSASLFFPEHRFLYTQWGFSGVGDQQRRASLLSFFDYLKLMGFNRMEFHPVSFGMSCYYNGGKLPNAATYDVFDDILPLAEERGIEVVPALDGLAFYDKSPEFTGEGGQPVRDSFQLDRDGKTLRRYFGDVPDPLRPEVQARLMAFLSEFSDRVRGHNCVPFISFKVDGKMGTCYSGDAANRPPEGAGYSEWDVRQFEQATGTTVGGTPGDAPSRYAALHGDPALWQAWLDWRCRATRDLWLKARDLVASRGNRQLLVKTILPNNFPGRFDYWQKEGLSPLDVLRGHGVDPRLYAGEKGMRLSRCFMVGADRYFGEEADKTFFYSDALAPLYNTAEGSESELYFVYWELPTHPKGFRVGPASGPGRAFFEPLTYTLRVNNPYNLTFYNWYPGTIGHEIDLRRFLRAYRALPAVPGKDFEGEIHPRDPRVTARWYGNCLAVINDTGEPQRVRLTLPKVYTFGTRITELGTGVELRRFEMKTKTRLEVNLQAWDLATLEVKELANSGVTQ